MLKVSAIFAAFVTALSFTNTASAMPVPVDVDFSFSTVSGTLTFAEIGETTADAISFSSDNFGEDSATFSIISSEFEWDGSSISAATLEANNAPSLPALIISFAPLGSSFSLTCFDLKTSNRCDSTPNASRDATEITFSTNLPPAVPLPAGLPLVLTGLAGFAGLRMRKKRKAQV